MIGADKGHRVDGDPGAEIDGGAVDEPETVDVHVGRAPLGEGCRAGVCDHHGRVGLWNQVVEDIAAEGGIRSAAVLGQQRATDARDAGIPVWIDGDGRQGEEPLCEQG